MRTPDSPVSNYGGSLSIRDESALDSAIAQPQSSFGRDYLHSNIHSMAAAYFDHIIMNHPFIDGNKRTAIVSTCIFLELNNHALIIDEDLLEETALRVINKEINKEQLTNLWVSLRSSSPLWNLRSLKDPF